MPLTISKMVEGRYPCSRPGKDKMFGSILKNAYLNKMIFVMFLPALQNWNLTGWKMLFFGAQYFSMLQNEHGQSRPKQTEQLISFLPFLATTGRGSGRLSLSQKPLTKNGSDHLTSEPLLIPGFVFIFLLLFS
jgi:hypothetical protein